MFLHDRTCCVCRTPRKRVQIHHIDDNPANHEIANLAVLCLECHDQTQTRGGFARHLGATEVQKFRGDWLDRVASRRRSADKVNNGFPGLRPSIRVGFGNGGPQILDSFMVSSFTDNGTGDFTVSFIAPLDAERLVVHIDGDRSLNYVMTPGTCGARIRFADADGMAEEDPKIFLATFDDGSINRKRS